MRSGNPALSESTFLDLASGSVVTSPDQAMTLNGTVNKTGFLLLLTVLTAAFAWNQTIDDYGQVLPGARLYAMGGAIGGLVLALITVFKKEWSPVTAPMYALVEGLFLGAISAVFNAKFPGIVFQAVLLTFGTLFALLFAYRSGLIKATENFKMGVVAATGGIALLYLASFVLGFFNINVPVIHDSSWLGIAFSLFVVVVAALNLVLDFDFIETGVAQRAPKYMEWYGAFGLMVTLVWLYVEFLRLLSKIQQRLAATCNRRQRAPFVAPFVVPPSARQQHRQRRCQQRDA
ncbi:Bax inhibitor-1/YccA family protein [Stenotrophomonas maltophilia]|nr:Bax inhibitor-1/YccA family protein [Stenotrophomonas maltophilia]